MSKNNRSKGCCNSKKSYSRPLPAVQAEICLIPDDVVTIPREEYVHLIQQSVENDILRGMLAKEDDSYGLYKNLKLILNAVEEDSCE